MFQWFVSQWQKLDRLAQSNRFKIVASGVVIIAAIAIISAYLVNRKVSPQIQLPAASSAAPAATPATTPADAKAGEASGGAPAPAESAEEVGMKSSIRAINDILKSRDDPTRFAVTVAEVAGLALVVIWLGLTFVYIAIGIGGVIAYFAAIWLNKPDAGQLIIGVISLSAAFTALIAGLRVLLSGSHPVIAIARNVLTESIRMKASLVFMVLLVLMLAFLPQWLDESAPLRYRVQTVLQFGTGMSFWIIALLIMLLTLSSICFEQRDKVIWQTMTKPVTSWQYLLGKWLGVVGLAAVLLTVCASGVFLFTEYLRGQKAQNEVAPYVGPDGPGIFTDDRKALETQVLVARQGTRAEPFEFDEQRLNNTINEVIANERKSNPDFALDPRNPADREGVDPKVRAKIREDLTKAYQDLYRTLDPGEIDVYVFKGLNAAKAIGMPLVLKFRIDSGSNRPDQNFKLTFTIPHMNQFVKEAVLGQDMVLLIPPEVIETDGTVYVRIGNGDEINRIEGIASITFPKGGLELSYPVATYRQNYVRVMFVLWIKLCFLAMVAVFCATFMSFPVACLVTLGVFFSAETTTFLFNALDYYDAVDDKGSVVIIKMIIRGISLGVAYLFKAYADLKPVNRLVEGELVPMVDVGIGLVGLTGASGVLFAIASFIFRRRELAVYSGQ